MMWCPDCLWLSYHVEKKKKISSIQKQVNFVVFRWVCVKRFQASVNFKNAEDVRRGWRIAHSVESEGGARDGLQLRAFVQSQEAGHLAGLQEVERVRPGGGGRAVALHALQLLRPRADGHHIQLHILRLLLIEQHLRRQRGWSTSHEDESSDTRELVSSQLFKWKLGPRSCYHNFFPPLFFLLARFFPDLSQLDKTKVWLHEISRNLISTSPNNMICTSTVLLRFVQSKSKT